MGSFVMRRFKGLAALLAVSVLLGAEAGCSKPSSDPGLVIDTEETEAVSEEPVRPQDDFYRYVNGDTLEDAEFAYGHTVAADANDDSAVREDLAGIINDVVAGSGYAEGTEEYIIQNVYNLYLDYDFQNEGVPEELDQLFHEIDETESLEEILLLDARLTRDYGVDNILGFTTSLNERGQCDAVLTFLQLDSVLSCDFLALYEGYGPLDDLRDQIGHYLQAIGHEEEEAMSVGTDLAYAALDIYNATDPDVLEDMLPEYFQLYSRDQLDEILTNVDIEAFTEAMGIDPVYCDEFGVYDPAQLQAINDMLTEENLPLIKAFVLGSVMYAYSDFVYHGYDVLRANASISYNDPSDDAVKAIIKEYGILLDPLYVEQYYTEETDEALRDMCEDIREQYREIISEADWLTEGTRQGLLNKLDNIIIVTGMNVQRLDPSFMQSLDYSNYFTFSRSFRALNRARINSLLEGPLDRDFIEMRMFEVNACYISNFNSVTITVASAGEPFFNTDWDYFTNLGALGATISHEIGHAFDSNCILYDENGIYNPSWIAPEDMEALNARNEEAIRYFEDNFVIFGIYHVDGEKTLGENYADLGGLECISRIPQTDEQMQIMFESYARSWCMKVVDEILISQIANDVHSPSWFRVNAMLSTLEAFYEVYDVQEGDGMYIPPENRISRWY